ncbi:MAG: sulfotransferase [Alphaproteobacteria bacterium]|nr:sulfotransferase [Alphaproteobacteria bacterium]
MSGEAPNHAAWIARFIALPRSERWYRSLFPADHDGPIGEITPAYATLDEAEIDHIRALIPGLKLIYILRNPIEQSWSLINRRYLLERYGSIDKMPPHLISEYLFGPEAQRRTNYAAILDRWRARFGSAQIYVSFYDELVRDPDLFLNNILDFLAVPHLPAEEVYRGRNNVSRGDPIPPDYLARLAESHRANVVSAHEMFDNADTARWLEMTEVALEAGAD